MKKGVAILLYFVVFLTVLSSISAQVNQTTDTEKINDAYACLSDKVNGNCDSLSTEEKIFSLLAIGQCRSELVSTSSNSGECWPSGACDLRTTAQAALALEKKGGNSDKAKDWILSKTSTPSEIIWYLQITSNEATTCQIEYSGSSYNLEMDEDRTLSGNAGPGLAITPEGYWLQIFPNYLDKSFQISCDKSFLTNTLFKKVDSPTIHVSSESSSAAAGGLTTETIESFCFTQSGACDYEGSLWAALALENMDEDIEPYLPYLITLAEENSRYLPESFLYSTTLKTDYLTALLSRQISGKWWASSSEGKFYDTALALYSMQHEDNSQIDETRNWLLDEQESDGCWDSGNIRNTAFLLVSSWPRNIFSPSDGGSNNGNTLCESSGNFCVPSGSCQGSILPGQTCAGLSSVCCTVDYNQPTCAELTGDICSSGELCKRGTFVGASDVSGRLCCVGDTCSPRTDKPSDSNLCASSGGSCRVGGCLSNEDTSSYTCSVSGDVCCIAKRTPEGNSALLWILGFLVILAVVAIVFREKLRHALFWLKSKFRRGGGAANLGRDRRFPPSVGSPGPSPYPQRRYPPVERRILPQHHRGPAPRHPSAHKPKQGASKELDDVLKKLKEMGK